MKKTNLKTNNPRLEVNLDARCMSDPFASLPPELRPRPKNTFSGLRKVTCPGCGLVYWTNRKTDLCVDCEKKGVHSSDPNTKTEG